MIDTALAAAQEAARVAQVGYTAVIDRMTPALDLVTVAGNVARSVGSAGGEPAAVEQLALGWAPAWRHGAVTLFEEHRSVGAFGTAGTFPFGITVQANGAHGVLAATAILHEPTARLRSDAALTSEALHSVIDGIRPGVSYATLAAILADATVEVSVPVTLLAFPVEGAVAVPEPGDLLVQDAVLSIGAIARSDEGPIVFQTTVHVKADGAERLEAFPLRLIELR